MSKRQQIGRQQVAPAAFEIRFSTTDSLEFVEISPDLDPERNIPDPFKKRDKIPRNSGSGLTLENFVPPLSKNSIINNDVTSTTNNNRQWNNKHNIASGDHNSQKTKFLNNNTNSNGGGKSSNSVGPEIEKPDRSTTTGKGKFAEKILTADEEKTVTTITNNANSTSEKRNKPDDELISNGISNENGSSRNTLNNKKRTLPIEEINVKENDILNINNDKDTFINMNGVTETTVISMEKINNNKIQNNHKNKNLSKTTTTELNYTDNNSSSMNNNHNRPNRLFNIDGISTPPMTPTTSQSSNSNSVDDLQILTTELSSPPTPPPGSDISDNNSLISTKIPRLSTSSRPIVSTYPVELIEQKQHEEQRENQLEEQKEPEKYAKNDDHKNKELKKVPRRRPTISHDEMIIPTIAKKLKMNGQLPYENHDALLFTYDELDPDQPNPSLTSKNGNGDITDRVEGLFNENKNQQRHQQRMKNHGRQSPASSVSEYRRNRKNSSSQKSSKIPCRVRNGSISNSNKDNDKMVNLSRERVQESSGSYVDVDVEQEEKIREFKKSNRKSRREEFVLFIRDEDEENEFGDIVKPRSSMSLTLSEPSMSTSTTLSPEGNSAEHEISKENDNDPSLSQNSQTGEYNANIINQPNVTNNNNLVPPFTLELERTFTSSPNEKVKKDKKKRKSKKSYKDDKNVETSDDDEGYIKKSSCCCIIC